MFSYNFIKDKSLRLVFGLSFSILVFEFVFIYLELIGADTPLVIHFDAYKGIDFIGGKTEVFGVLFLFRRCLLLIFFWLNFFITASGFCRIFLVLSVYGSRS